MTRSLTDRLLVVIILQLSESWTRLITGMTDHTWSSPALIERLMARQEGESLKQGAWPLVDELDVTWAIEAPGAGSPPIVVSTDGQFSLNLTRIAETDLYAGVVTLPNRAGFTWRYEVDGVPFRSGGIEVYVTPEENKPQEGVPKGKLRELGLWRSDIFPGTTRSMSIYIPAGLRSEQPTAVMIFQDGEETLSKGVRTTLDNLIYRGEIPPMVGIFINPGKFESGESNRQNEYDSTTDRYARFLLEEILPAVEKIVKLRRDPAGRALMGTSSGGACSWTAAWHRPIQFGKVVSWVGSFANMICKKGDPDAFPNCRMADDEGEFAGAHNYPFLIRRTDRKPIRVFLQANANDLDIVFGNWPLCNQQMAKALEFKGYDYRFEYGNGFHSHDFGMALFPDTLRWLWRDEPDLTRSGAASSAAD
jgi:enterochelin esterase-like enzyme